MTPHKRLPPNAGKGRVRGVPNVATKNARLAIAGFIEGNSERLNRLLDEIERREGARAAWECVMRLLEHHMPRVRLKPAESANSQTGRAVVSKT